jgi:hypothetical protein
VRSLLSPGPLVHKPVEEREKRRFMRQLAWV